VRIPRPRVTPAVLMWVGLIAAPSAWAAQHVAGVELTFARCHDGAVGPSWDVPVDASVIAITAASALVAVLGGLAAVAAWHATREADDDDAPPAGRIHFLGIVGLTISPLFLAMILMSGIGTLVLPGCVQS
jgi:hypothetical protein